MDNTNITIPSEEEIKKLLEIALKSEFIHMETVGELLGMKWCDSLLPKLKDEPKWDYKGLWTFLSDHGIETTDSLKTALKKLK